MNRSLGMETPPDLPGISSLSQSRPLGSQDLVDLPVL